MPPATPPSPSVRTLPDGTVVGRFPGEPGTGVLDAAGCARPLAGWLQVTVAAGATVGRLSTVAGQAGLAAEVPLRGWREHPVAREAVWEVPTVAGRLRVVLGLGQYAALQCAVAAAARVAG